MADRSDPTGSGYLVEDFIGSITTQLDRVQDALRIKAVNRPLTYALKELHLELKVFVDMDNSGQVRLRASGPNESGASTLAMDFTTITKPMIEENTISLAASRSTPLDQLGLSDDERGRLERLGVSNVAQLDRLKASTGMSTVAHLSDVPLDRLRRALQSGQPQLGGSPPRPPVPVPPRPAPPPARRPPVLTPPIRVTPAPPHGGVRPPLPRPIGGPRLPLQSREFAAEEPVAQVLQVAPHSPHLLLAGRNLLHEAYPPEVRLNGELLPIDEHDDDRLVVRLPEAFEEGVLEVRLGDAAPVVFALVHDGEATAHGADPWAPLDAERGTR